MPSQTGSSFCRRWTRDPGIYGGENDDDGRVCLVSYERRLSEAVSASICVTPPSPTQFYCDSVGQSAGRPSNRSFISAARLERLNTTRFTVTSSEQPPVDRQSDVDDKGPQQPVPRRGRSPAAAATADDDADLVDFRFVWIVFLTLDAFLVTRRIGNF